MKVSIVIVNYNGKNLLKALLASIKKSTFTDYEVIIVDNNSSDGSQEFIKKNYKNIVISDTIGFIYNLPPTLIDSFQSTLLESINADLILHVADINDDKLEQKIKIVEEIITDLGISDKKQVLLFNKIDMLHPDSYGLIDSLKKQYKNYYPQFISVKSSQGIEQLKQQLFEMI